MISPCWPFPSHSMSWKRERERERRHLGMACEGVIQVCRWARGGDASGALPSPWHLAAVPFGALQRLSELHWGSSGSSRYSVLHSTLCLFPQMCKNMPPLYHLDNIAVCVCVCVCVCWTVFLIGKDAFLIHCIAILQGDSNGKPRAKTPLAAIREQKEVNAKMKYGDKKFAQRFSVWPRRTY